jgi:hypothetical protein
MGRLYDKKEDKMHKIMLRTFVTLTVIIMVSACTGTPRLYRQWGKSVETAKQKQTVNPQAGQGLVQTPEMDGNAAGLTVDRYRQSFKGLKLQ